MFQDEGRSKNPGTKSSVPGCPVTKYISIHLKHQILFRKNDQISCFRTSFSCFRASFSVLERPNRIGCQNLVPAYSARVPDFNRLSWPVPSLGWILSLSHCHFIPENNEGTSVPLCQRVALSRFIGNAS